jgi:STE24 endopeptidase
MNYKIIVLIILGLLIIYNLFLELNEFTSFKRPIPEKVNDIYDNESYLKWKNYKKEKLLFSMIFSSIDLLIAFALLSTNVYSKVANYFLDNIYYSSLAVMGIYLLVDFILSTITNYINTMYIEQKYGFNKTKVSTFIKDRIRSLITSTIIFFGILVSFIYLHQLLGVYIILAFILLLALILLLVIALYPYFSKISNKFEPLEEGELKDKLTNLLTKHGYTVRKIEVMTASERTTKSNAYFSGFGKTKTIVLFDNLINEMTPDEICAVFAHELGHGLHKDTLKINLISILMFALIVVSMWGLINIPELYQDFNFFNINYGFAFIVLSYCALPFISTVISLFRNAISRKAEYQADLQAVKEGRGEDLISSLKKLARSNFADLNPSKITILLSYSHPTINDRIINIEKHIENKKRES